jgi:hypothetical protein
MLFSNRRIQNGSNKNISLRGRYPIFISRFLLVKIVTRISNEAERDEKGKKTFNPLGKYCSFFLLAG